MVATGLVSGQANSDGRAILIFGPYVLSVAMPHPSDPNTAYEALKGAGCMPFSQSDDGLAVIPSPICLQKSGNHGSSMPTMVMLNALAPLISIEIALGNKAVCKGWTNNMSDEITSEWHTSGIEELLRGTWEPKHLDTGKAKEERLAWLDTYVKSGLYG
ncbi:hypothetical protein BKA82DRAFT_4015978 [Pisolithus tinctorius]|nr:hypothetical protein BKA82DRAFT_4015978 [Pisolithus tinctorius]